MVRDALKALLRAQPGTTIVGEAEDGRTAVRMAAELLPDVVLMDINMPQLNGIEATRQIASAQGSSSKIVVLSARSDRRSAEEVLKAGAMAYVAKDSAFEDLSAALRSVMDDKIYLSPTMADGLAEHLARGPATNGATVYDKLSPREREVLQLLAEGKAMKQIAMHLHVSTKTVETHRRKLMAKLGLESVAELTKYALREGITTLDG